MPASATVPRPETSPKEKAGPGEGGAAGSGAPLEIADALVEGTPFRHDGDVMLRAGIHQGASADVGGNLTVEGVIHGARVLVRGDLCAPAGVSGRDEAVIEVRGRIEARYIDSARVVADCGLRVEREMVNSSVLVHGGVDAPEASVVGGALIVTRAATLGTLGGSSSSVTTLVVVGGVPMLEPLTAEAQRVIEEIEARQAEIGAKLERLNVPGATLSAREKEQQTELSFAKHSIDAMWTRCVLMRDEFSALAQRLRTTDLRVEKCVFPGVEIQVGDRAYRINRVMQGPLRVTAGPGGALVVTLPGESEPTPLKNFADVGVARQGVKPA
jgi:uncharacterized protein (DUF342 family)